MSKNNKLINSLRMIAARNREFHIMTASERDTPAIYSAIAVALYHRLTFPDEEKAEVIMSIFADSQEIWTTSVEKNIDINQLCIQETGIDILGGNKDE